MLAYLRAFISVVHDLPTCTREPLDSPQQKRNSTLLHCRNKCFHPARIPSSNDDLYCPAYSHWSHDLYMDNSLRCSLDRADYGNSNRGVGESDGIYVYLHLLDRRIFGVCRVGSCSEYCHSKCDGRSITALWTEDVCAVGFGLGEYFVGFGGFCDVACAGRD